MIQLLNPIVPIRNYFSARAQAKVLEQTRQKTIDDVLSVGIIRESVEGLTTASELGKIANMPESRRKRIIDSLHTKLASYQLEVQVFEEKYQGSERENMAYLANLYAVQRLEGEILPIYQKLFPKAFDRAA